MFLDWKKQYYQNDHIILNNLQIQCNSYQTTNGFFYTTQKKKKITFAWKHKRLQTAKAILWSWRDQAP